MTAGILSCPGDTVSHQSSLTSGSCSLSFCPVFCDVPWALWGGCVIEFSICGWALLWHILLFDQLWALLTTIFCMKKACLVRTESCVYLWLKVSYWGKGIQYWETQGVSGMTQRILYCVRMDFITAAKVVDTSLLGYLWNSLSWRLISRSCFYHILTRGLWPLKKFITTVLIAIE